MLDCPAVPRLVVLLDHLSQLVVVVPCYNINKCHYRAILILTIELFPRLLELVGAFEARAQDAR